MTYARVVRDQVLSGREKEFGETGRCIGGQDLRITFRHHSPNTVASIIVVTGLAGPGTMLAADPPTSTQRREPWPPASSPRRRIVR